MELETIKSVVTNYVEEGIILVKNGGNIKDIIFSSKDVVATAIEQAHAAGRIQSLTEAEGVVPAIAPKQFYYIQQEGLTLADVQGLNSMSKPWTPMDFARSYTEIGKKNYSTYIEFKKKYGFNHDVLLAYLGLHDSNTPTMFKNGSLVVSDIMGSTDLSEKLIQIGEFYPRFNRRSFALAFKKMWSNEEYNHEHMMAKMRIYGSQLQDYAIPEDYLRQLEKFYNHQIRKESDRVRFF